MLHDVKNLSVEQRRAVETLLGRPMAEDESVSIKGIRPSAIVPSRIAPQQREEALEKPLSDTTDLDVLQTAERGEADILCTHDDDFSDPVVLSYCTARGIEVCDEFTLLERLTPR